MIIDYTSPEGYRGILYGKSSMAIYDPDGVERLHTGARAINTLEELKEQVDGFPEFFEKLMEARGNEDIHEWPTQREVVKRGV